MRTINYAGYRMVRGFRSIIYKSNGRNSLYQRDGCTSCAVRGRGGEKCHCYVGNGGAEREHGRNILIEHNLRLVVYIARKFDNTGAGMEDLISIGTIGLIKAINSYNPDKNIKLATYASRCI